MPFAALVAVFILPLIPLLFPPSCPSLPTFEINLKIVVAFCGSFFPLPPFLSLSRSHYGTNRLKNAPKRIRFHVDYTLFLSLHCTCFLFFAFPSLSFFLGKILKLLDRNKAANCAKLFSPLFILPPALPRLRCVLNQPRAWPTLS